MKSVPLCLRLTLLPAFSAAAVVLIAALSMSDLRETQEHEERVEPLENETLAVLERKPTEGSIPSSRTALELSEAQALRRLAGVPDRAALLRLWPLPEHRERLSQLLLSKDSPEDVRLFLLGRFESEAPEKALEAARSIAKEKEISQGPLLYSTYEILSRLGGKDDLALLGSREFELQQTKTFREECRARLEGRVGGKN